MKANRVTCEITSPAHSRPAILNRSQKHCVLLSKKLSIASFCYINSEHESVPNRDLAAAIDGVSVTQVK